MTPATAPTVGIDFGTTNTVVAVAGPDGEAVVLRFDAPTGQVTAFRSALSFQIHPAVDGQPPQRIVEAGPWAIEAYVEDALETRFIQSFKTFAASAAFTDTVIDNRRYRFEDLLGAFLLRLRNHGGEGMADLPARVIVGRPVTFAGRTPDEQLALGRYEAAFARLGFTDIRYAYEPIGAAFFFARTLEADANVLVADFGGGTSDFSVVRFERTSQGLRSDALARSGVGVAGHRTGRRRSHRAIGTGGGPDRPDIPDRRHLIRPGRPRHLPSTVRRRTHRDRRRVRIDRFRPGPDRTRTGPRRLERGAVGGGVNSLTARRPA